MSARRRAAAAYRVAGQAGPGGGVVPPRGGTAGAPGCRRRDEPVLPPRRGRGGHPGPGHPGDVHRRHARAPRGRGRPAARRSPGARRRACTSATRPSPAPTRSPRRGPWRPRCRPRGPFDLVLLGRNSIDGETGQVGPEVAELLDLPFASGVRAAARTSAPPWRLELEHDDGRQEVEIELPAVLSVAERLCDPCKVDPRGPGRRPGLAAHPGRPPAELGPGPWGEAGQPDGGRRDAADGARALPARPGGSRRRNRCRRRCASSPAAARWTRGPAARPAPPDLTAGPGPALGLPGHRRPRRARPSRGGRASCSGPRRAWARRRMPPSTRCPPGEAARRPAGRRRRRPRRRARSGRASPRTWPMRSPTTSARRRRGPCSPRARRSAARWPAAPRPRRARDWWATPSRSRRTAAALVAAKPAFAGALVADITCRSATQMVTVRPGVLPAPGARAPRGSVANAPAPAHGDGSGCCPTA